MLVMHSKHTIVQSKLIKLPSKLFNCPSGEIGRRAGLKIQRDQTRAGSSPALGTKIDLKDSDVSLFLLYCLKYGA